MKVDTYSPLLELQMAFGQAIRSPNETANIDNVSDKQLSIYRELFWNNFESVIASAAPVARAVLPENAWTRLLQTFWREHRAQTPEYTRLPFEFAAWLYNDRRDWEKNWPWLGELVTWEVAELAAMFAEDGTFPTKGVALHPSFQLMAFSWPVHQLSVSWLPPSPASTFLGCYRNACDEIDFIELTPLSAALFDLVQRSPCLALTAHIKELAIILNQDIDELASAVQPLVNVVTERGILLWGPNSALYQ